MGGKMAAVAVDALCDSVVCMDAVTLLFAEIMHPWGAAVLHTMESTPPPVVTHLTSNA